MTLYSVKSKIFCGSAEELSRLESRSFEWLMETKLENIIRARVSTYTSRIWIQSSSQKGFFTAK